MYAVYRGRCGESKLVSEGHPLLGTSYCQQTHVSNTQRTNLYIWEAVLAQKCTIQPTQWNRIVARRGATASNAGRRAVRRVARRGTPALPWATAVTAAVGSGAVRHGARGGGEVGSGERGGRGDRGNVIVDKLIFAFFRLKNILLSDEAKIWILFLFDYKYFF